MDRRSKLRILRILRDRMPTIESYNACEMSRKVEGMIGTTEEIRAYAGLHLVLPEPGNLKFLIDFFSLVCFVQARQPESPLKAHSWRLRNDKWVGRGPVGFQPETSVVEGATDTLLKVLFQGSRIKDREGRPRSFEQVPPKAFMNHGDLVVSLGTCGMIYRHLRKQGWPKSSLQVWEFEPVEDFFRVRLNGCVLMDTEDE